MHRGSPEWLAWNAARKIDVVSVRELAELAADQAALLRGQYSVEHVAAWFHSAGVARPAPETNFSNRCGAASEKFMLGVLSEGTRRSKLEGVEDLQKLLGRIAKSERQLAKQLHQLLGEATRGGHAATDRGHQIQNVYRGVLSSLLDGLADAARFEPAQRGALLPLLPEIYVEHGRYAGGRIMWEAGLRRSADWITRLLWKKTFWASLSPAGRPISLARAEFVQEMSEIWLECTGALATFSDASPFYRFMRAAYGHMCGLREAANPKGIKRRWRDLRLDPIPTARTMRNDLRRLETKSSD